MTEEMPPDPSGTTLADNLQSFMESCKDIIATATGLKKELIEAGWPEGVSTEMAWGVMTFFINNMLTSISTASAAVIAQELARVNGMPGS